MSEIQECSYVKNRTSLYIHNMGLYRCGIVEGRYTDDILLDTCSVFPNYGAKELSTTNIAWGRRNYSVVVRIVITSSLSSASEHVPLLLGQDQVKNRLKYTDARLNCIL